MYACDSQSVVNSKFQTEKTITAADDIILHYDNNRTYSDYFVMSVYIYLYYYMHRV